MTEAKKSNDHLEIHALMEGGYVVREGRWNLDGGYDDTRWMPRYERAAFSTLREAIEWMAAHMIEKSPSCGA